MSDGVYLNFKSGTWFAIFDGPRRPDGSRKQVKRGGFRTEQAAVKFRRKALSEVDAGLYIARDRGTVGEFLQKHFLPHQKHLRPSTRRTYAMYVERHVIPALGRLLLAEVRPVHIQAMYDGLHDLAPLSVRHVHAITRVAFRRAVDWGLIPVTPVRGMSLPAVPRREFLTWSPHQARLFLQSVSVERDGVLYAVALTTGLRRGELIGLRWQDIRWDEDSVQVAQSYVQSGREVVVCAPKTRRSGRTVAVDHGTLELLRKHRVAQAKERLAWGAGYADTGLVFTREDGSHCIPSSVSSRFQTLQRGLGLPRLRLHDLRHTHATLALEAGVPLTVVSDRLGHSTIAITADTYSHVRPAVAREAAAKVGSVLFD